MPKKRAFFWGVPLLLLLIGLGWGYYLYHKPHQSAAGKTTDLSITADSLFRQYRDNEQNADRLYLGKTIEVTGTLSQVVRNGDSEIWILSAGAEGGVNCQLFSRSKGDAGAVRPGMQVKIKGKCTGFLMDVNLADCVPE